MERVRFKGSKEGLRVYLNEEIDFRELFKSLQTKLLAEGDFFGKDLSLIINSGQRILTPYEAGAVWGLAEVLGHKLIGFEPPVAFTPSENLQAVSTTNEEKPEQNGNSKLMLLKRNLRSGQSLSHEGPIILFGDVNPGAYISSCESVLVVGSLRGTVHVGYPDREDAWVMALQLKPMQIRIGKLAARSPDEERDSADYTEIAYVRDGRIIIEEY